MKKNKLGMLLLFGAAVMVASCSKSDDKEVFVGDNFNAAGHEMKD